MIKKYEQTPSSLVMVRPAAFGFNPQTAASNVFQLTNDTPPQEVLHSARQEFEGMVRILEDQGVDVRVFDDQPLPQKPDAVFPNNWVSFHEDGKVVLYPLFAPNRRLERRTDIIESLRKDFEINEVIDLSGEEDRQRYLEGTGSLVFDHINRIAFACRSSRTDVTLVDQLCRMLHYRTVIFNGVDERQRPVYHTNVIMSVGSKFAVLCLDAIHDETDQEVLLDTFGQTGHKVIAISYEQMRHFAGNMLEIKTRHGDTGVLISERAFHALLPGQLDAISKFAELIPVNVKTIEQFGGGSVRCMVAGVHLKKRIASR